MKKIIFSASIVLWIILTTILLLLSRQKNILESKIDRLEKELQSLDQKIDFLNNFVSQLLISFKVSKIRELAFLEELKFNEITKQSLYLKLIDELKKEYPEQSLENTQKVLMKFGLLNSDVDLFKSIIDLFGEQISAFYDVESKTLYTIKGLPLGKGLQDAILAHEITHALQDQNYQIKRFVDPKSEANDDQRLAYSAVIEGDASLVTQLFYLKSISFSFFLDLLSYFLVDQKEFNKAPFFLRENLLFPYIKGLDFINHIYRKKGWDGINRIYLKPPRSSEEILHPTKYMIGNDPPITIAFPKFKELLSGYSLLEENVLGEFNIQVLFRKYFGENTNKKNWEGWGGDRYQVLENANHSSLLLIWLTHWDTAPDAYEFFLSYNNLIPKKYPEAVLLKKNEKFMLYKGKECIVHISINHNNVLIIEADTEDLLNQIIILFEGFENTTYNGKNK